MKAIKVDDETYQILQKLAEEQKLSIKEIASKAIKAYYNGTSINPKDKEVVKIEEKIITLKYPARCSRCKKELKQGEIAFWQRYTYEDKSTKSRILCMQCYNSEKIADSTLAKLTVKEYMLKKKIKALDQEIKKKVEKLAEIQYVESLFNIRSRVLRLFDYLEKSFDDKNMLYEVKNQILEILDRLQEHEEFAKTILLPKYVKKIRRKEYVR